MEKRIVLNHKSQFIATILITIITTEYHNERFNTDWYITRSVAIRQIRETPSENSQKLIKPLENVTKSECSSEP